MIDLRRSGIDKTQANKEATMPRNHRRAKTVRFITLCTICVILSGCATMFAPGEDEITIKSEPEGAEVYDGANLLGKTPLTYSFVRDTFQPRDLTIRMKGRKSYDLRLRTTLEKTALWNLAFVLTTGGATSWGIDALSGHLIRYSPNSYLIDLENAEASVGKKEQAYRNRLRFVVVNHDCLKKDIARGQGEYLRAYYEIGQSESPFDDFQSFLNHVSGQAQLLLAVEDPVDFYRELDGKFNAVPISQNREQQGRP
ncbi:MAG TPA: PEGA domain-containing protein [Nitrospirota bacterium]|nr:PEGA domain-containing protein [Nitrospirota bacterium]